MNMLFFYTAPYRGENVVVKASILRRFRSFFTLNAWADYTLSGSALCDRSQANNADR